MEVRLGRRSQWDPPLHLRAHQRAAILRRCFLPTGGTWGGAISVPDPAESSTTRTRNTGPARTRATFTIHVRPTTVLPGVRPLDSIPTAEPGCNGNPHYRCPRQVMCS